MYMNVQLAARALGVSPQTVRRWTSSGFLPCTRTAGGHRRIRQEDVDELAQVIGGSNHLAARRARERELETLMETSIALAGELEEAELLREIARRLTRLMDCHFCGISAYDAEAGTAAMLADYDHSGRRLPSAHPYPVSQFPLTRAVLEDQRTALVNVGDRVADPDEVAELVREGDRSLLMVPLVYRGRSIGLLELIDHGRDRRYSRQELRLCTAIAGQAAVALHNARVFREARDGGAAAAALTGGVENLRDSLPDILGARETGAALQAAADAVCRLPGALGCAASSAGVIRGAMGEPARQPSPQASSGVNTGAGPLAADRPAPAEAVAGQSARVVAGETYVAHDSAGGLALTVSFAAPVDRATAAMLDMVAAVTAASLTAASLTASADTSAAVIGTGWDEDLW